MERLKPTVLCEDNPILEFLVSFTCILRKLHEIQNDDELTVTTLLETSHNARQSLDTLAHALHGVTRQEDLNDLVCREIYYLLKICGFTTIYGLFMLAHVG